MISMKITRKQLRKLINEARLNARGLPAGKSAADAKFNRFRAAEILTAYDEEFHETEMGLYIYQNVKDLSSDEIDNFVRDIATKAYNYVFNRVGGNPFRGLDRKQGIESVYNSLSESVNRFLERMRQL